MYVSVNAGIDCNEIHWLSLDEEIALRNSDHVRRCVDAVRMGDETKKLLNYYYTPQGMPFLQSDSGIRKKAEMEGNGRYVLDYDVHGGWETAWKVFEPHLEEWGVELFERSYHMGAHIVLKRHLGFSIQQERIYMQHLTGLQFDKACTDISRAIFLMPMDDVIYMSEDYDYPESCLLSSVSMPEEAS